MENLGEILEELITSRNKSSDRILPSEDPAEDDKDPPCEHCGGRGWLSPIVPTGHKDFGKLIACACQVGLRSEDRYERLLRYSNLGYLTRFTFTSLDRSGRSGHAAGAALFEQAFRRAVSFSENPEGWLVFTGSHGSGKTHLAAAIANQCIENGIPAVFVHVPDLLDHLRSSYSPLSEVAYTDLFDHVRNSMVLVLDGFGIQSSTPWAHEKLQQLLNHRGNGRLPTVITTASDLTDLDPFVLSRIRDPHLSRILPVEQTYPDEKLRNRLGQIPKEMLTTMTFETFDTEGCSGSTESEKRSLEAVCMFAKNYAAGPDGWLTLFSESTGVGKTHLAVAIANERIKAGESVFFAHVPELLDHLRYAFSSDTEAAPDRLFQEIKNCPLLVMDDLGRERGSPWTAEKLYQILVHRHNRRLATIITTSTDFEKDEVSGTASRIQDPSVGEIIRIEAKDFRRGGMRRRVV